ncbi:hypothetical protein [Roseomonas rosulenta]|uniref:hypothetical protein n=1 Tax=Roseomonas rosulenta TaxID=2748667 RepID=UPI0018DF594C|nr:hypothetical protein [Roseomonas rosulenta]
MALTVLATVGAARAQSPPLPIGTARMEPDGTIVLDLVARQGGTVGHGRLTYPPSHPDHAMILRHLGGLRPGEVKPVPPFP